MKDIKQRMPDSVVGLEAVYGAPSQAGFGSAVFHDVVESADGLEDAARAKYKHFVGELWERWGAEAWMGPWKEVYVRQEMTKRGDDSEISPDVLGKAEIIVGKQRHGPTGDVNLLFDGKYTRFENLDKNH